MTSRYENRRRALANYRMAAYQRLLAATHRLTTTQEAGR